MELESKNTVQLQIFVPNFPEDSEVGRSQGNSAGRNASVLGPGRSVDLSCASAEQKLPGSKEETAICKNLDWNQRSAVNVILCRCYTRYSLARPLEALCSRVHGSTETCLHGRSHCGNPRFMARLAQSQRNLSTVSNTPTALSFKSFRSEFQLWVHVCPRDFAFSWTRVGETDSTGRISWGTAPGGNRGSFPTARLGPKPFEGEGNGC